MNWARTFTMISVVCCAWAPRLAQAQSCNPGYSYCSAGWCCPGSPGEPVCCNSNPESSGCTTNGVCSTTNVNTNPSQNNNQTCPATGVCAGPTCDSTGSGSCDLEACVSNDGTTCYYTLNGSEVCTGSCASFTACEDQAGTALSNCESGGGNGSCALTSSPHPQTGLALFGMGIAVLATVRRARSRRAGGTT